MPFTSLRGAPRVIWWLLALCLVTGAALNLYRTAWRPAGEARAYRGFYPEESQIDGETVRWSRGYSKAEVPLYQWHPLRWTIDLTAPAEAADAGASTWILVNDVRIKRVTVGRGWHAIELVSDAPPARDLALQFQSAVYGPDAHGVGVGRVNVKPVFTIWNVFQNCAAGALVGLCLWLVCVLTPIATPTARDAASDSAASNSAVAPSASPSWRWPRALAVLAIVWIYFAIWTVLKPPLQAPDETQQLMRATSVRAQGWATLTPDQLTIDPRFVNPIVYLQPWQLSQLYFQRDKHLTLDQIADLEKMDWPTPLPAPVRTPLATYPPVYYGTVFALAEATTAVFHLTPYQNIYAYRAWTVVIAGLLWLLVYRAMLTTPDTAPHATALFALLLLNAMLAFVTSSVSPDAVNVPLATLAVLLTYRTLRTGRAPWLATAALVACGLTKPSILLLLGAIALPILLAWRRGVASTHQALQATLALARAGLILFCIYYAWSPPRFFGSLPPKEISLGLYADAFFTRLPVVWWSYWGMLGWLDYSLDDIWYILLLLLIIAVVVLVHRRRTPEDARFVQFAAWLGIGYFVLMTIGEYWYLPTMGYNFQGRHLLPVCIAWAGLVLHSRAPARWAVLGYLGLMNVALMYVSIGRYFTTGFSGFWASLPWR